MDSPDGIHDEQGFRGVYVLFTVRRGRLFVRQRWPGAVDQLVRSCASNDDASGTMCIDCVRPHLGGVGM